MNRKAASETHQWVDLFVAATIQVIYWKRGDNCVSQQVTGRPHILLVAHKHEPQDGSTN